MEQKDRDVILIIDDDITNIKVVREHLKKQGLEVIVARNGKMGLERAGFSQPDLILLDVKMPDIDGFETCRRLKENKATGRIPVIFMTVLTGIEDKLKGFRAGGVDYITKPVQAEEVLARVTTHLALRNLQKSLREKNAQLERANSSLTREITGRKRLEDELKEHRHQLEEQVKKRTAELSAAASELQATAIENARLYAVERAAREQLHTLTVRLIEVEEAERRRLARELHDQAGQNLTTLSLNLKILQTQIAAAVIDDREAAERLSGRLDDASRLVNRIATRIRNVMDNLRPPALEEYGLLDALRWYGDEFSARTNVAVSVHGPEAAYRLPPLVETALFRIAQEALTNVARHAQAARVEVTVEMGRENEKEIARLVVADDGTGFDPRRPSRPGERQHWGLQTMAERAGAVGGACRLESAPGEGTRVIVEIGDVKQVQL